MNLDEKFVEVMAATYGGTRLGRQELDGELIADVEGALWPRELIETVTGSNARPDASSSGSSSGSIRRRALARGATRAGSSSRGGPRDGCSCLPTTSCQGLSPDGWASRVAAAVARWDADIVVAEANNGGAMVGSVLKAAEPACG